MKLLRKIKIFLKSDYVTYNWKKLLLLIPIGLQLFTSIQWYYIWPLTFLVITIERLAAMVCLIEVFFVDKKK